jgi:hypothetical protein
MLPYLEKLGAALAASMIGDVRPITLNVVGVAGSLLRVIGHRRGAHVDVVTDPEQMSSAHASQKIFFDYVLALLNALKTVEHGHKLPATIRSVDWSGSVRPRAGLPCIPSPGTSARSPFAMRGSSTAGPRKPRHEGGYQERVEDRRTSLTCLDYDLNDVAPFNPSEF